MFHFLRALLGSALIMGQSVGSGAAPTTTRPAGHVLIGIYGGANNAGVTRSIQAGVDFLMPSVYWYEPQPWLKDLVRRVRPHGIKVYPSLAMAYDGYGDRQSEFARSNPQFWERLRDGRVLDRGEQVGLCWACPQVRRHKVDQVVSLVQATGVDGVLLDYTRFFGNAAGYNDALVSEFRRATGKDALTLPCDDPEWLSFRAGYVTRFVAELRKAVDAKVPGTAILACVNPDPRETLKESMQDWGTWVREGLLDGVVSMIYERDTNHTLARVMVAREAIAGRVPHFPMIAPYGGNLTTPEMLFDSARKCLAAGVEGVAFYREDAIDEHGLWDAIRQIGAWNKGDPGAVNYVLNPGFESGLENWAVGSGEGISVVQERDSSRRALRMVFPGRRSVRQIVDCGILPGRRGLSVSARLDTSTLPPTASVFVKVEVCDRGGGCNRYQVPVSPGARRRVEAQLPAGRSEEIAYVMISVEGTAATGHLDLGDVVLGLLEDAPTGCPFRTDDAGKPHVSEVDVNLARGQVVRGTSFWEIGYEFDRAVDGRVSNEDYGKGAAWHSQRPARDQWITIYFPEVYVIGRIRLLNASAHSAYRTHTFRIEASRDHVRFQRIAGGTLPDDGTTWTEVRVPPTPARYLRFVGETGFVPDYAVGLKEIEVYPADRPAQGEIANPVSKMP